MFDLKESIADHGLSWSVFEIKVIFLEFHEKALYTRRALGDRFVKDRFEGLMIIDNGKITSVKVLMKPFDSKDNR